MTDPLDGDYGYDMAHEVTASGSGTRSRPAEPAPGRPARNGSANDAGEDLGYDEAHDF